MSSESELLEEKKKHLENISDYLVNNKIKELIKYIDFRIKELE